MADEKGDECNEKKEIKMRADNRKVPNFLMCTNDFGPELILEKNR